MSTAMKKLEKKISRLCRQAAVLRYVEAPTPSGQQGDLIPLPLGQRLKTGQVIQLTCHQN